MTYYLLVHGVVHGAWCWDRTVAGLEARGHVAHAIDLPLTSLADDVAATRARLDELAEPVVLVGHSYGGHVISHAAAGRGDVAHLVYVAALMLAPGEGFIELSATYPESRLASALRIADDLTFTVDPDAATECFYAECEPADAAAAVARLRPTSLLCPGAPAEAAAWQQIPSTYVVCERDAAVHPDAQRAMSVHASNVVSLDTDHSPFLSRPDAFVEILGALEG